MSWSHLFYPIPLCLVHFGYIHRAFSLSLLLPSSPLLKKIWSSSGFYIFESDLISGFTYKSKTTQKSYLCPWSSLLKVPLGICIASTYWKKLQGINPMLSDILHLYPKVFCKNDLQKEIYLQSSKPNKLLATEW